MLQHMSVLYVLCVHGIVRIDEAFFLGGISKTEVLKAFDSKIEFPEGSGVSYTNYFFKSGLHLSDYSDNLYMALKKY